MNQPGELNQATVDWQTSAADLDTDSMPQYLASAEDIEAHPEAYEIGAWSLESGNRMSENWFPVLWRAQS